MGTTPMPPDGPQKATYEVDTAALEPLSHAGLDACPVCKNDNWFVLQTPGRIVTALPLLSLVPAPSPVGAYPMVALACSRCGFTKLHLKVLLDQFIAKPAGE